MKKIKNFISQHDSIILIAIMMVIVIANMICKDLQPYDNLWNFGNMYKMTEGQLIYQDINVIQTPIFFEIGAILLKIISANYLVFMIYGIIIMTILYYLVYKIAKALKLNKTFSILITLIIMFTTINLINYGTNYNTLAFIFFELGVLSLINGKDEKHILQAFFTVLIFLTYQKLGVGYFLLYLLYETTKNKNLVGGIKNVAKVLFFSTMMMIIVLLISLIRGTLNDFINMCFLSISEFTNNTIADNRFRTINRIAVGIVFFFSLFLLKNKKLTIDKNNILILLFAALGTNLNIIPIINEYHVKIALIFYIILFVYELYFSLFEILNDCRVIRTLKVMESIILIEMIVYSIMQIYQYATTTKTKGNNLFLGAIISGNLEHNITNVDEYLDEKKENGVNIKILSSYAMLYTLDKKIDNGFFDEPLIGNLGKKGINELIDKIKELPNDTLVLVENEERTPYKIYQFAKGVRDYIYEHYDFVETIENYDVYKILN